MRVPSRGAAATLAVVLVTALVGCDPNDAPDATAPAWPSASLCADLEVWPNAWSALERDALDHIDAIRAQGADCGEGFKHGRAPALRRVPALDCAARFHAQDMATQGYVGRLDPDGRDETMRVEETGYLATTVVQHLAAGPRDATELVEQTWLPRAVPCVDLLSADLSEVGLGYVGEVDDELESYWVIVLATPAS